MPCLRFLLALCFFLNMLMLPALAQSLETAILPLRSKGETRATLTDILTDRIRAQLLQRSRLKVMERSQVDAILKEQGFQGSAYACQEESCAIRLGQMLSVRQLVLGSVSKVGNLYALSLRMVDTETGQILAEKYFDCYCTDEELLTRGTSQIVSALLNDTQPESQEAIKTFTKDPLVTALLNIPGPFGYLYLEEWGWFGGLLAVDGIALLALLANNWAFPGGEATAYLALAGTRIFGIFHGPGLANEKNRQLMSGVSPHTVVNPLDTRKHPLTAPTVTLLQQQWQF